jgi:hypothetical protein
MSERILGELLATALLHKSRYNRWKAQKKLREGIQKLKCAAMKNQWVYRFNEALNRRGSANNEYFYLFQDRRCITL